MTTRGAGSWDLIARVAAYPSMPGISRSMTNRIRAELASQTDRFLPVPGFGNDLDQAGQFQQLVQVVQHLGRIVHEQNANRG